MVERGSSPPRGLVLLLEALGVALLGFTIVLFRDAVVDDAFITLRHAQNLLDGHGLVWNPGERVEGITNLGFCLATAGLGALGVDLLFAARLLGMAGAGLALWLGPLAFLPGPAARLERAVARLWMSSCFAFVYLAWTGLETGFYVGVVATAMFVLSRTGFRFGIRLGLLVGLAFATRPDGITIGIVALALAGHQHGFRAVLRSPGPWLAAAIGAGIELFRWLYYGALIPGPARVKGIMANAAASDLPWYGGFTDDFVDFFVQTGGAVTVLCVVMAIACGRDRPRIWLATGLIAVTTGFGIYSGGDWMLGYRYLMPMLPAWIALATAGLTMATRQIMQRRGWNLLLLCGLLVLVVCNWSFALRFRKDARAYPNFVMTSDDMIEAGQWLAAHYPKGTTITCWRIGALGYFSELTVIDTNGLTDPEVAARLHDPAPLDEYLALRHPRLAIVRGRPLVTPPATQSLYGLEYRHVRTFPQGDQQTWELYEFVTPPRRRGAIARAGAPRGTNRARGAAIE